MRTTVDLPDSVHRRASELARRNGVSLSTTVAELTIRGLTQMDEPPKIVVDSRSGFPTISVGRRVTVADVADALDDE